MYLRRSDGSPTTVQPGDCFTVHLTENPSVGIAWLEREREKIKFYDEEALLVISLKEGIAAVVESFKKILGCLGSIHVEQVAHTEYFSKLEVLSA